MNLLMAPQTEDPIPTRYSLLSRLQNWDDQESWKEFFDTYWRLIYAVAIKSGLTETEAQDVVQETVICVARHLKKFKRDRSLGSFKGWLRNITRWRIADQLRKRVGQERRAESDAINDAPIPDLEQIPDPSSGRLDSIWEHEWEANLFEAAVQRVKQQVKEEQFQMFDLYVTKGWPVLKVARTLGVSAGRVYLAKHRVAALIKKEVARHERTSF